MSTWRSEEMINGTLVLPADRAKLYLNALGLNCNIEFFDMNEHSLTRPYRKYIQRIEELERMLRFLFEEISKLPGVTFEAKNVQSFLSKTDEFVFDSVEEDIQKVYNEFKIFQGNNEKILDEKVGAFEQLAVYKVAYRSMAEGAGDASRLLNRNIGFSSIAGVIVQEDVEKFSHTLFRMTRGNAFTTFEALAEQAQEIVPVSKSVFVVYFQGTKDSVLYGKIKALIEAFTTTVYIWPESKEAAGAAIAELEHTLIARQKALSAYDDYFVKEISFLVETMIPGENSLIGEWSLFCKMEKATYAAMDMFEGSGDTVLCRIWVPAAEEGLVRDVLQSVQADSPSVYMIVEGVSDASPPTYFRNTGFTLGFQNFVNTYGVPRYREVNPAVITSITLPFLFGIMYGDIGHGFFVLLTGIYMVYSYESLKKMDVDLVKMLLGGRYIILLMGLFSVYAGFLYNDFLSVGLNLFGTRYKFGGIIGPSKSEWVSKPDVNFPYPFGIDPVWKGAENELMFVNSFKMKFSIIIAGFHMGLGVLFKAGSAIGYGDYVTLMHEFLPQMLFFICFVGYLDFIIIYKWIFPGSAPNLISTLIEMAMCKKPTIELFRGQYFVQMTLMGLIMLSIPWMLVTKPLVLKRFHDKQNKIKQAAQARASADTQNAAAVIDVAEIAKEGDGFDFGECLIHQLIESIEFILGSISNTASYLRLWALSLAHQQLALVFFEQTIMNVFNMQNTSLVVQTICLFMAFAIFACITMMVMLGMDSLECFLHALRLQWVEFQSKFYKADGRLFRPFVYKAILEGLYEE